MKTILINLFLIFNLTSTSHNYYIRSNTHIHADSIVNEFTEILLTNANIYYNDTILPVEKSRERVLEETVEYYTKDYIFIYKINQGKIVVTNLELTTICIILDITKQAKKKIIKLNNN
jgi:hypothetical protein